MPSAPPTTTDAEQGHALVIDVGHVQLFRLYDVADAIDLAAVERALRARSGGDGIEVARLHLERRRDAVAFTNPPVTAVLGTRELSVGGVGHTVSARIRLFDFGALTVQWSFAIPRGMDLEGLARLSAELESGEFQADLAGWMDGDADLALASLHDALSSPTRHRLQESLTVYVVSVFAEPPTAARITADPALTHLVLGERERFSQQLLDEVRAGSFSYSDRDLVVIGYDQAFVYDPVSAADISALLEFALAQVLELGFYDRLLDERLAEIGSAVSGSIHRRSRSGLKGSSLETMRRELMVQHVDLVQVLERITAAVKVTEDLYYAKIYREAMRIFRAEELIEATDRKLELVFRTYTMLADEVESHVAHRLEWIVIVLILMELVLSIVRH